MRSARVFSGDRASVADLYTDDVRARGHLRCRRHRSVSSWPTSRVRDDAFSAIELETTPLDVGGDYACVEWSVTMTHTGPLVVAGGAIVEPTGAQVTVHGVTVAEFRGEQICSLRQYWDEFSVFDQLGMLRTDAEK